MVKPACTNYIIVLPGIYPGLLICGLQKEVGKKIQEEAINGSGTGYKTVSLVLDKIVGSSISRNHRRLQNYLMS